MKWTTAGTALRWYSSMRVLLVLVLWLLQCSLILLFVDADGISREVRVEQEKVAAQFSESVEARISSSAGAIYGKWFQETGWIAASYGRLLPSEEHTARDIGIAPWFFKWLKRRLDAFWNAIYRAIYRTQVLWQWGPYTALLAGVAVVDGLMRRKIKAANHEAPSSDRYTLARRGLFVCAIAPLVYLSFPTQVPPLLVLAWAVIGATSLLFFAANMQQRV